MKMNLHFLSLSFGFVFFKFTYCLASCEGNNHEGYWICAKNEDLTLNLTYDCLLNGVQRKYLWLWSSKYPEKINSLTIKNCEELTLYTGHKFTEDNLDYIRDPLKINFRYLNIVNVNNLLINNDKPSDWTNHVSYDYMGSQKIFYSRRAYFMKLYPCLLHGIVFENGKNINLDSNFLPDCTSLDIKFEKVINFNVISALIGTNIGAIEITDSNFNTNGKSLSITNGKDIIIRNNYFGDSYQKKLITLKASKIVFSDNEMELLKDDSLSFTGKNIQIINNTFHHIEGNAFKSMTQIISGSEESISNSFNFSNNVIYSLAPGALSVTPDNTSRKSFFDNWIIANNQFACNCDNLYWFDSVVKEKNHMEHYAFYYSFYHKWFKPDNQNTCLNIPYCSIGQVMNNYLELCENDYNCSKVAKDDFNDDIRTLKEPERVLTSLINYNYEMNRNISNLLENLTLRIESKILKNSVNSNSSKIEKKMRNYSIFLVNGVRERQKQISNLPYERTIEICIFVIAVLFVIALSCVAVIKFLKFPLLNAVALKLRVKPNTVTIKTDANSSLTELTPDF